MRYMLIENGAATNAIEVADPADFPQMVLVQSDTAHIGDTWDGTTFSRPAPVVVVPHTVTRKQARKALALAGLLSSVQPEIDAITDATQRELSQIDWDDSATFERDNTTLLALAAAMSLSSAQVDALFIQAATL